MSVKVMEQAKATTRRQRRKRPVATGEEQQISSDANTINLLQQEDAENADITIVEENNDNSKEQGLLGRLGTLARINSHITASVSLVEQALYDLRYGDVTKSLRKMVKKQIQAKSDLDVLLLSEPKNSSYEFDEAFKSLERLNANLADDLSPKAISTFLKSIELSSNFFPRNCFDFLLRLGLVSDLNHPNLIDRIISKNSFLLILNYVRAVSDLTEASLFKIIEYTLNTSTAPPSSLSISASCGGGLSSNECILLTFMSNNFESTKMRRLLQALSIKEVDLILSPLLKLYQNYTWTHLEAFTMNKHKKSPDFSLPSKKIVLKWLDCLIQSRYPSIVYETDILYEKFCTVNLLLKQEEAINDSLLGLKGFLSTLASLSSKKSSTSSYAAISKPEEGYFEYSLEKVTF